MVVHAFRHQHILSHKTNEWIGRDHDKFFGPKSHFRVYRIDVYPTTGTLQMCRRFREYI